MGKIAWFAVAGIAMLALPGCASAPMTRGESLASYDNMAPSDGALTKSLIRVSRDDILAAKSVRIVPTTFPEMAAATIPVKQRILVANAVDRSLCAGLSDRFEVVGNGAPADLTVHAVITHADATDEVAAGTSKVVSIIPAALSLGVPVPVPRIPIGLGSLTLEAEAIDRTGRQQAAMIWARGADSFTSSPRVSTSGDAYELGTTFGGDFSRLLVTGSTPFGKLPELPSLEKIGSSLGGKPKYVACSAFGKALGLAGLVAGRVGAPPEWTDDGAAATPTPVNSSAHGATPPASSPAAPARSAPAAGR
ncbi:MAG: hypothetical protein JWP84_4099 [Tardiphaga sp.]|nr:hypothetical protein [Tardiphaga sp.]